jgi:hypothetical protein
MGSIYPGDEGVNLKEFLRPTFPLTRAPSFRNGRAKPTNNLRITISWHPLPTRGEKGPA